METDRVIREMEKRGYTVTDESGVLMFTGMNTNIDESISDIKKTLAALEFKGSWGTKGYPKGKIPSPAARTPAKEEEKETVHMTEEPSVTGDYSQMTFDFS